MADKSFKTFRMSSIKGRSVSGWRLPMAPKASQIITELLPGRNKYTMAQLKNKSNKTICNSNIKYKRI